MNEEFIPAAAHVVPEKYQLAIKGIEYSIRSAAIASQMDFGGTVEEHEGKIRYELCLHLFAGEPLIGEYDG